MEKEKSITVNLLNRDIKKLERDVEERQERIRTIYNQERLKLLKSNLHMQLLMNTEYAQRMKAITLINSSLSKVETKGESQAEANEADKIEDTKSIRLKKIYPPTQGSITIQRK